VFAGEKKMPLYRGFSVASRCVLLSEISRGGKRVVIPGQMGARAAVYFPRPTTAAAQPPAISRTVENARRAFRLPVDLIQHVL